MSDPLTEVRFWAQVIGDAKRTVLCSPDLESRCKGYVAARGLDHLITVKASPFVPDDKLIVLDEQAMEAEWSKPVRMPVSELRRDGRDRPPPPLPPFRPEGLA